MLRRATQAPVIRVAGQGSQSLRLAGDLSCQLELEVVRQDLASCAPPGPDDANGAILLSCSTRGTSGGTQLPARDAAEP